jgi:hypothetical protein
MWHTATTRIHTDTTPGGIRVVHQICDWTIVAEKIIATGSTTCQSTIGTVVSGLYHTMDAQRNNRRYT